MAAARDRRPADRRLRHATAPMSRCRTAATTAAPSASSPMAAATPARPRRRRWSSRSRACCDRGFNEVVLTGVDLTSWGADLPGAPRLGDLVAAHPAPGPRPAAAAALVDRFDRGGPAADAGDRHRTAADAASAPVAAARRRPDPEADEAPPPAATTRSASARTPARLRPGIAFGADLIAGFPTETEAHVRELAAAGRGLRPDLAARLPLFAAPGHAGRAHAAGRSPRAIRERAARLRALGAERVAHASGGDAGADGAAPDGAAGARPNRRLRADPARRHAPAGQPWWRRGSPARPKGCSAPKPPDTTSRNQDGAEVVDVGAGRAGHEQVADGVEGGPGVVAGEQRAWVDAGGAACGLAVPPSAKAPALSSEPSMPSVSAASAGMPATPSMPRAKAEQELGVAAALAACRAASPWSRRRSRITPACGTAGRARRPRGRWRRGRGRPRAPRPRWRRTGSPPRCPAARASAAAASSETRGRGDDDAPRCRRMRGSAGSARRRRRGCEMRHDGGRQRRCRRRAIDGQRVLSGVPASGTVGPEATSAGIVAGNVGDDQRHHPRRRRRPRPAGRP